MEQNRYFWRLRWAWASKGISSELGECCYANISNEEAELQRDLETSLDPLSQQQLKSPGQKVSTKLKMLLAEENDCNWVG